MPPIIEFSPGLHSAGQPTPDQFEALAAAGVRTVINLRAPSEPAGFDEPRHVRALGLAYVQIPVSGADDLTRDKARQLASALAAAQARGGTLIHCASGNRVGAMLALVAAWERQASPREAMQLGLSAGMTTLQPAVSALLA
jgi:uncharacterized protein (TIGR01244 family)